jgi:hypothetical protein
VQGVPYQLALAFSAAAIADLENGANITRMTFVNLGPAEAGVPALNVRQFCRAVTQEAACPTRLP